MIIRLATLLTAVTFLAACEDSGFSGSASAPAAQSAAPYQSTVAPPPGRTEAEREARRDFYRGPRYDVF